MIFKISGVSNANVELHNATFDNIKYYGNQGIQFDRPNNLFIYNSRFIN